MDNGWQKLRFSAPINSPANEDNPFSNGKVLIFESDRPGGKGGYDLYYSTLQKDGSWATPHPLGGDINSADNESQAFISGMDRNSISTVPAKKKATPAYSVVTNKRAANGRSHKCSN